MTWRTNHLPSRTVQLGGETYLYCSGTSYLGMSRNEAFAEQLREGMSRYGTNYSSSRRGNLQLSVYEEAETYLARFTGAPMAVTVSSGLLAGQLVIRNLPATCRLVYAPQTHPALWCKEEDAYEGDWHQWAAQLPQLITQLPESQVAIVTNALDPLQAESYDFGWVTELPLHKDIRLVVDDSHGLGITGPAGGGIYHQLARFPNIRLVVVASLGKALGLPGGVILGDASFIEKVQKNAYFSGASPVPPAYLYAFLRAENLYREARNKLQLTITHFSQVVEETHLFRYIPHYPIFYTPAHELYEFLLEKKVLISSFPYPTSASDPITRIVLSSLHEPADVLLLKQHLTAFAKSR